MSAAPPTVGFLGLGIMGAQMVLAGTGARVTVWNRSASKAEPLRAMGAAVASTPAEVTASCDLVFTMLADPRAAKAVAMDGPDSAVAGIASRPSTAAPATYVDCSTVDAATGETVGAAVTAATTSTSAGADGTRGGFLAAPVSGGWRDAKDGKLLFLCGGSAAAYEAACVPHGLDVMGHRRWLFGYQPGDAARAKLMLQVMMGNIVGSLAEMMALTKAAGLDEGAILEVLGESAMANPLTAAKGQLMRRGDYSPNFQVYLQQKDLRLALQLADDLGVPAPISAASNGQYIRARQMGLAEADFAAVRAAYDAEIYKESVECDE